MHQLNFLTPRQISLAASQAIVRTILARLGEGTNDEIFAYYELHRVAENWERMSDSRARGACAELKALGEAEAVRWPDGRKKRSRTLKGGACGVWTLCKEAVK